MNKFSNILFLLNPNQEDSPFLDWLLEMARANQARLTIMDVISELPGKLKDFESPLHELRQSQLREMMSQHLTRDVHIDYVLGEGVPFIEIIRQVLRGKHDLVLKDSDQYSGVETRLGSTDMHLLRKCPCPVWIMNPNRPEGYRHILAAIDVDPDNVANSELNNDILDLSIDLARRERATLHIVHAWGIPNEVLLRDRRFNMSFDLLEGFVDETRRQRERLLDEVLMSRDLLDIDFEVHLSKMSPSELITRTARNQEVDLIVMGTVARTGIAGFFIGNTAEKVVQNIQSSLLTVKPKAFVSPVSFT